MRNIIPVKAILFDMDGVITNTMPDHYRAWKDTLASYGVSVSAHDIYAREGQPGAEALEEIFLTYKKGYGAEDISRILLEKEQAFKRVVKQRFIAGARSLLREFHDNQFQLALVTGTSQDELHNILPDELYQLFHATVTGSDVKMGKPHPEPFEKALDKLSVLPHQAVVIENAPYGIKAAKAAGIKVIALETSLTKEYLHEADWIYPSIQHMKEELMFQLV